MRILLVEDDKEMAALIGKAFHEEGFTTEVLYTGGQVLSANQTTLYNVIVLDVMLPVRDGLSVLRQLRQSRTGTPVL